MPSISDIDSYNSALKSELTKLIIVAVVLFIIFIGISVYSIVQIKKDKSKKLPYVQLVVTVVMFAFLGISLGSQISSFAKDIDQEAYVLYEGPATVREEHQVVFGDLPTGYTEYIISFEQDGEQIELSMRKDYELYENIEKIYIVYSKHSNYILELKK